jgi:uncharacterized protein (TIRG00374 family)
VVTLKKHVGVPTSKGVSTVFIQSFTENISMVVLALAGAIFLNRQVALVLGLLLLYIVIFVFVRSRRTAEKSRRLINKLPFLSFARSDFHSFIHKNRTLLSGKSLGVLFVSGFVSTIIAISLLYIVANDLDISLDIIKSTIVYALPTVLQNVSFLPGGIGVNEQGTVGILVLLGAALPAAVALTLIMRFVTLVMGVVLGVATILASKKND